LILAFVVVPASVVVSGILFALGYTVCLPTIVVWAGQTFAPAEQARSTALTNTVFNVGGALGQVIGGLAISNFGFSEFAFALCFLSAAVGGRAFFARQTAQMSVQADRP